jgi:primosomal protein N' (replication factor Y)
VVIQTASPESRLIVRAAAGDFPGMTSDLLAERALYGYPPYSRLSSVMLRHTSREILDAAATRFGELIRHGFGNSARQSSEEQKISITGPAAPVVERIKDEYALMFLVKIPRSRPMSEVREVLTVAVRTLRSDPAFRKMTVTPNVDPQ